MIDKKSKLEQKLDNKKYHEQRKKEKIKLAILIGAYR